MKLRKRHRNWLPARVVSVNIQRKFHTILIKARVFTDPNENATIRNFEDMICSFNLENFTQKQIICFRFCFVLSSVILCTCSESVAWQLLYIYSRFTYYVTMIYVKFKRRFIFWFWPYFAPIDNIVINFTVLTFPNNNI